MGRSFYIITALVGFLTGVALYLVWQPNLSFLFVFSFCSFALAAQAFLFWVAKKKPKNHRGVCETYSALSLTIAHRASANPPEPPTPFFGDAPATRSVPFLHSSLFCFCLFFLFLCLGLMRAGLSEHRATESQVDFYNGQKVELFGVITETDIRRDKAKYTVQIDTLSQRNDQCPISNDQLKIGGNVLITLNKYPQLHYGDRVKIFGELQEPGEFNGFNYGNYLSRYGIYSVMYYPKIDVLESDKGNLFWAGMSWSQNKFLTQINKLLPEPHASFEAGLLVGARKGIPDDLMNKFNITGLTHIIAISGYNITIIIVFVMWMLAGLPRKTAFAVAIIAIILFTLFVGASPAVTRASIMGILGLIALNYGRQNNIHITVLMSAFLMVLWNPRILWWDVGFQLSFAAVLGLIYVAPLFQKYAEKLPQTFGVREAIQMTMSAQVMALPIIIYNFERLSIIAPIANLFVIFAIPPAMLFGFIAVVISFLSHILGLIPAYIAWGILSYIIGVIEITASIPYASIDLPGMKIWMMFGYYILLALVLFIYYRNRDSGFRIQNSVDDE